MRIHGILETALYVRDPPHAAQFYQSILGFAPMVESDRLIAMRIADGQVLLLFRKDASVRLPHGAHDGDGQLHVALGVPTEDLGAWETRLAQAGVLVEERRVWEAGGTSLYFRDPDGHLVELATPGVWPNY